jgi:hypothetical protein
MLSLSPRREADTALAIEDKGGRPEIKPKA